MSHVGVQRISNPNAYPDAKTKISGRVSRHPTLLCGGSVKTQFDSMQQIKPGAYGPNVGRLWPVQKQTANDWPMCMPNCLTEASHLELLHVLGNALFLKYI